MGAVSFEQSGTLATHVGSTNRKQAATGLDVLDPTVLLNYAGKLFRLAYRITRCREDAEDVVQETILRVYQRSYQFQGKSAFTTWVTSIAVNQALDRIRKRGRAVFVSVDEQIAGNDDFFFMELSEPRANPEQACLTSESNDLLTGSIRSMPRSLREAFVLHHVQETSIEETAKSLGVSVSAAKSRLLRARRYLRERLKPFRS